MRTENKMLLERAVGIIEAIAYSLENNNTAEGLFNAAEMIDGVIKAESEVQGNDTTRNIARNISNGISQY